VEYQREPRAPSAQSLRIIEGCAADLSPSHEGLVEWHDGYVRHHKQRLAFDLDIVRAQVVQDAEILEIGSVPLVLTAALLRSDYRITGCDIAPERYAAKINQLGIKVVKCDIEKEMLPFEGGTFDALIFNELFEHLRINPIFTLSEALRVLKPGGILILSTPNLRSLGGIKNFLLQNRSYSCEGDIYSQYQKLDKIGHMGHVREYTTREVIDFLEKVGFGVSKVIHRGRYGGIASRLITAALAGLRPFVSYVAVKRPAAAGSRAASEVPEGAQPFPAPVRRGARDAS
jgi:SAM-dependent methyltransferase